MASFDARPSPRRLFVPDGAAPVGGLARRWCCSTGSAATAASTSAIAQSMGLVGEHYVVLTVDARGHGAVGRPDRDRRAERARATCRRSSPGSPRGPDVADATDRRLGHLPRRRRRLDVARLQACRGRPSRSIESWTNLRSALVPQGLAKSGVIAGFLGSLPPAPHRSAAVFAIRDAAYSGALAPVDAFAAPRTTIQALKGVTTPVFMMQGRRDFAFGMGQALQAYNALAGPKRLWLGLHGHAPSTFPAADSGAMLAEGTQWFDRYLRGQATGIDLSQRRSPSPRRTGAATPARFDAPPKPVGQVIRLGGSPRSRRRARCSAPPLRPGTATRGVRRVRR